MRKRTRLAPPKVQREYDWAFANYPKLVKRYPNQWVAFAHRKIVAGGPNLGRVLEQAHAQLPKWSEIPLLFVEKGIHIYALGPRGHAHARPRGSSFHPPVPRSPVGVCALPHDHWLD